METLAVIALVLAIPGAVYSTISIVEYIRKRQARGPVERYSARPVPFHYRTEHQT